MADSKNFSSLLRAAVPEDAGVDSKVIESFLRECDEKRLNMHSFMAVRGGKVAAECYWAPFRAEVPHAMFSFSKGITGTAIGFAVSEGLLSLDDKVAKFFPYKAQNAKQQAYHDSVTVRQLITHKSGKKISVTNDCEKNEWLENWLSTPFTCAPGEKFIYTSENIYMLSRIISKLTGQTLTEYLTPRLFEPLEIEIPYWEKDHNGYDAGGWGLFFKTEDMAKVGMCYLNHGMYNGRQVIPAKWVEQATKRHVQQIPSVFNEDSGYGFQIFIQSDSLGTYSFNGLYSQFVVIFPKHDAVFVCTAGEPQEDVFMKLLWRHFPKAFTAAVPAEKNPADSKSLCEYISECENRRPAAAERQAQTEKEIDGMEISVRKKDNASVLGAGNHFMLSNKAGQIDSFKFSFADNCVRLEFQEKNSPKNVIEAGLDGSYRYSLLKLSALSVETAAWGTWLDSRSFKLTVIPLQMAQYRELTFTFRKNGKVTVKSEAKPGFKDLFEFYMMFSGTRPGAVLKKACGVVGSAASLKLDPNLSGQIKY